MYNCAQTPWLVPTNVELNTRDLDVRDITATNGSFKTLSVDGEVYIKQNPNMSYNSTSTTFQGNLVCTAQLNADTLLVNQRAILTECLADTLSSSGLTIAVQSNMLMSDSNTSFNAVNIACDFATIKALLPLSAADVGYTETGTNASTITLNTTTTTFLTGPSIVAGTWLITFRVEFFVTSCTVSNSIYLRLYEGGVNTQTFYEIIPPATNVPVSIQGSVVVKTTTTKTIVLGARLHTSGPTANVNNGMIQITRVS